MTVRRRAKLSAEIRHLLPNFVEPCRKNKQQSVKAGGRLVKHVLCYLLTSCREPSYAAAVWKQGATDGGSQDPSSIEPPVAEMKKSIPGKDPEGSGV